MFPMSEISCDPNLVDLILSGSEVSLRKDVIVYGGGDATGRGVQEYGDPVPSGKGIGVVYAGGGSRSAARGLVVKMGEGIGVSVGGGGLWSIMESKLGSGAGLPYLSKTKVYLYAPMSYRNPYA